MGGTEQTVRTAFVQQAEWCRKLGSPFTGLLCDTVADRLDRSTAIGRRVLGWPGVPDSTADALPLRLAGGLHALVARGDAPRLAGLYPPHPLPAAETLWPAIAETLVEAEDALMPWLDGPPQTNEVARSAVLMAGLLVIAARTGQPLSLFELGASAGLNLVLDRYAYRLGTQSFGERDSALSLSPAWEGPDPPAASVQVVARRGVDMNPLDVTSPADRERLLAYIWADQGERIARIKAALAIAAAAPPPIDRGDAAAWLEQQITPESAAAGVTRVVMHSIAFQYFPADTAARISAHLDAIGARATRDAPLAWLRYEAEPGGARPTLRLKLWPDGVDACLASADAHGRSITWQA